MDVYWLEQTESHLPSDNGWLNSNELASLARLRFAPRLLSWRLGRWTAKRAVATFLNRGLSVASLANIEIRPASSGAPEVFVENKLAALTISLSHREDRAICAVSPGAVELGCDLEIAEPHSDAFVADYFTAEEQSLLAEQLPGEQWRFLAILWSAKESALKALHAGLRLDTRSVVVSGIARPRDVSAWGPLQVRYSAGPIFHGWWRETGNIVRTIVANPAPSHPIELPARSMRPPVEFVER